MLKAIRVEIKPEEIIEAVKKMKKRERSAFLEDLLAATSPEYLESIKEARADYKAGRVETQPLIPNGPRGISDDSNPAQESA